MARIPSSSSPACEVSLALSLSPCGSASTLCSLRIEAELSYFLLVRSALFSPRSRRIIRCSETVAWLESWWWLELICLRLISHSQGAHLGLRRLQCLDAFADSSRSSPSEHRGTLAPRLIHGSHRHTPISCYLPCRSPPLRLKAKSIFILQLNDLIASLIMNGLEHPSIIRSTQLPSPISMTSKPASLHIPGRFLILYIFKVIEWPRSNSHFNILRLPVHLKYRQNIKLDV